MAEKRIICDTDLPRELHNWAVNTMHFGASATRAGAKIPTVDDFRYICRGQMNDIWRYVITHVYPVEYVRKVKGNLMLKRLQEKAAGTQVRSDTVADGTKADLLERKRALLCEIKATMLSKQHIEQDIERIRKELSLTEESYKVTVNRLQDINQKQALLKAYSNSSGEEIERIEELTCRIQQNLQRMKDLKKKASEPPVMVSRTFQSAEGATASCLETSCAKEVREACEVIGNFLNRLLEGTFEGDESAMSRAKEDMWRHVESVVSNYPASSILVGVCEYADSTSARLKEKTASIDIHKEVEQLRLKFENGHLSDLSTPPTVFESVNQILEANQTAMFEKFIETEKSKNNSWKLQKRLADATAVVDEFLCQRYKNPEELQLARTVVETETRLASARGAVNALNAVSKELSEKIAQATADKEILLAKHQKIQDFKKIVEMKQNLIRVLINQNMSARTKLLTQQSETVQYVERSLKGRDSEMLHLTGQLKDYVATDAGTFTRLQLPLLPVVSADSVHKKAIADLSIYKLHQTPFVNCRRMMNNLLTSMKIPSYLAPECLLPKIAELHTEHGRTSLVLKIRKTGENNEIENRVEQLRKLCEDVSHHDKEQMEKILPVLQQRLTQATQTLADCIEVKDTATYWWEQPAQYCTPWITIDGMNLQQWHDKFMVTATRLRQLPQIMHK